MKKILVLPLLFSALMVAAQSTHLIRHERIATITKAGFDSLLHKQHVPRRLAPIRYDVDVHEVDYVTTWWDGSKIMASGLIMLPKAPKEPIPLVAYGHGTRLQRERLWKMQGEESICAFFAADGYAVCMPDYIGLGRGERSHLYHHATTEATCMIDMLSAMQELNKTVGIQENGQLFLSGYSQGGHVAMATHRYLQQHPERGFKVTASAPMSGAYDLAGVQGEVMHKPYEYPGYLPFLLFSYQAAYNLLPDSAAFFKAPYDSLIPPYFDGNHKLKELAAVMPAVPSEVLREDLWDSFQKDPQNPLRLALAENTLIHWAPEAPVLMCYCKADEQVSYRNALVARDTMEALGSKVIQLRHAGKRFRHGPCALYTCIYAKMWIDGFRDGGTKGKPGPAWNRFLVSVSKAFFKQKKPKRGK